MDRVSVTLKGWCQPDTTVSQQVQSTKNATELAKAINLLPWVLSHLNAEGKTIDKPRYHWFLIHLFFCFRIRKRTERNIGLFLQPIYLLYPTACWGERKHHRCVLDPIGRQPHSAVKCTIAKKTKLCPFLAKLWWGGEIFWSNRRTNSRPLLAAKFDKKKLYPFFPLPGQNAAQMFPP